jgi:predicted phage-related endonuclease
MSADLIQGSPEWIAARLGSFGASALGALMAKGEGKTRAKYIDQLVCERLSGRPQGWEGNDATESGHAQEPLARRAYEMRTGAFVESVGLIRHPRLTFAHASPDGLVGDDGGLELKSHVKFVTHFAAIQGGMSKAHQYQCQFGMACTGRNWWDYGHYCADAPEHLQLFMFPRVKRDDAVIADLVAAIEVAEQEVAAKVSQFSRRAA